MSVRFTSTVALSSVSGSYIVMPNPMEKRPTKLSLLLVAGMATMLGGCVAAVVPIAAGGMIGKKALLGHKSGKAQPATAAEVAAQPTPVVPPRAAITVEGNAGSRVVEDRSSAPATALMPPPPSAPASTAEASASAALATTWDAVARSMAGMAARVPDRLKVDVLQPRSEAPNVLCGARRPAVAIDATTLGSGDYLYVGALYTAGFEVVLMSPLKELPPAQVAALKKQGIAAPVRGTTLFSSFPGSERASRLAMAKQYCVVALVGDHAGDFPNSILPGSPQARDGWFLVPRR